jgi:hypothetical protein
MCQARHDFLLDVFLDICPWFTFLRRTIWKKFLEVAGLNIRYHPAIFYVVVVIDDCTC